MKRFILTVSLVTAAVLSLPAIEADDAHHPNSVSSAAATAAMAEGEVRKVDKERGRLTIKHGPLENLDMPSMTMVFRAKDPAMLDQVKQGDKIKFVAEKIGGAYFVTRLEPVK